MHPVLDWTRELMDSGRLVPGSDFAGGKLVAVDPQGQEAKIALRKFHIDVHVEDGFARTTIDQTYFNHENFQLEGTFYFPLPADASLSRLAMYVDGNLMEGGMVERDYARVVYESIRYTNRDPALLEWLEGTTFKMRVFPLEPRSEKRLILSYTQKLPVQFGQTTYRFPAGHSLQNVDQWSCHVRVKEGKNLAWNSSSHPFTEKIEKGDLILDAAAKNARTDRDVVVTLTEKEKEAAGEQVRFYSTTHEGAEYLMVRYRPDLSTSASAGRARNDKRLWVVLFEASGDRDPLLARTQIEIARHFLAHAEPTDTFLIAAANTRVRFHADAPQPVTAEDIAKGVDFLEKTHLIGALDLAGAITAIKEKIQRRDDATLVHVGSGVPVLGERRTDQLLKVLPRPVYESAPEDPILKAPRVQRVSNGARYVGIGVGRRWNRALMKAAAEQSGGHFTQINPDEPIGWRAFELFSTLATPRLLNASITGERRGVSPTCEFLAFNSMVAQGEELVAIARMNQSEPKPTKIRIDGTVNGKPLQREVNVDKVSLKADAIPRMWAKLEIDRLLALDPVKHKPAIIAISKAMYVMSPYTSLLVLEHEDLYQQYKVDRGRKDHWAMYPAPAKIPVVYEPEAGSDPKKTRKPTVEEVLATINQRGGFRNDSRELRVYPVGNLLIPPAPPTDDDYRIPAREPGTAVSTSVWSQILQSRGDKTFSTISDGLPPPISQGGPPEARKERGGTQEVQEEVLALLQSGADTSKHEASELLRILNQGTKYGAKLPLPIGGSSDDPTALLYERPDGRDRTRIFHDLLSFAPGMNTSAADMMAVSDEEAMPTTSNRPGTIDSRVAQLFQAARSSNWYKLTRSAQDGRKETIVFQPTGSCIWERELPPGIVEEMAASADARTLVQLYPQLHIGARRTLSRFHVSDLASEIPWIVPAPEDLARGRDLLLVGERTAAIVSHGESALKKAKDRAWFRLHFVFGADGMLAERQLIKMPKQEVVFRQVLDRTGSVRLLDQEGKELAVRKGTLTKSAAPKPFKPPEDMIVLSLPYRTASHVRKTLRIEEKNLDDVRLADALPLFATHIGAGHGREALTVFQRCFFARDQRQLGYYVLLASAGVNLDGQNADVLAEHLDDPLAQYLALHSSPVLRKHASQWAVQSRPWQDPFLGHLATTHALYQRWQNDKLLKGDPTRVKAEWQRAFDYVAKNQNAYGWTLLSLMQDRAGAAKQTSEVSKTSEVWEVLAEHFALFAKHPALSYAARYEEARSLLRAGQSENAGRRFKALYEKTFKADMLPAIDGDFRKAVMVVHQSGRDGWSALLRETASALVEKKRRPAVLALAWQCWQLNDQPLANTLFGIALDGIADQKEKTAMTLAGIEFLWQTNQVAEADRLLSTVVDIPEFAKKPGLWRLALKFADHRDQPARSLECLERALELEQQDLPEVVNLENVRGDYGKLLEQYHKLSDAMLTLKVKPAPDFYAKVVRAADRWRALDLGKPEPCNQAAWILQRLGDKDLAWDYLTTPLAFNPTEAEPWLGLAGQLTRRGDLTLADRAFEAAFHAEPTNPQILWDRAQNLRRIGKTVDAQRLVRQIADGKWQPRFQGLVNQARAE